MSNVGFKKKGELVEFVTPLHKRASRNYLERMQNEKVHCSKVAREYEKDYCASICHSPFSTDGTEKRSSKNNF